MNTQSSRRPARRRPNRGSAARGMAVAALLGVALVVGGCSQSAGQKEQVGTVIGAVAGGVAGSAFGRGTGQHIMIGVGTLAGALIGMEVGRSLDRADQAYATRTTQRTLETAPTGQTGSWVNPDSGHSGTVTPVRTYQRQDGTPCREFTQTVQIGGKTEEAYGTACRQADGSWKIVSG